MDIDRTPEEDVIRLGNYKPEEYSVITTGDANIMRSIELPAIRGAICYSQEAPLYPPVLAAHAAGDIECAKELVAYIGKGRAVTGGVNGELAVVPPGSPTAVSVPSVQAEPRFVLAIDSYGVLIVSAGGLRCTPLRRKRLLPATWAKGTSAHAAFL